MTDLISHLIDRGKGVAIPPCPEPKPCPLCKRDVTANQYKDRDGYRCCAIRCQCGLTFDKQTQKRTLIQLWNARGAEEHAAAEVAEWREERGLS